MDKKLEHPDFVATYKWDDERMDYFLVKRESYGEWLAKKEARSARAKKAMETKRKNKAKAKEKSLP